jgi:endonuclease/exonuclease/phosphatase (EEP) superfamily protein YafD
MTREVLGPAAAKAETPCRPRGFARRFLWPDWRQRKRMLLREAWIVVIASYPLLLGAHLVPYDWRNESTSYLLIWLASFFIRTFQFHLGLVLLVIFCGALLRRLKRLALATLPVFLFTFGFAMLQFVPQPVEPSMPPRLRVMSANLLMVNTDTDGIIGEVLAAKPDVLMLQEYTAGWHAAMQAKLAAEYPYSSVVMRDDSFGIAIYSRRPFAGEVDQRFPLGRAGVAQMRAEIDAGDLRIALYNVHLLPPRTLLYAGEHRLQVADLLDALKREEHPYIVSGDFNFPDLSPQQSALKRNGAREAHQIVGYGRGATWPVNSVFRYIVPGLRIDHVFLSRQLTATSCKTGEGRGSDHRPVIVDVAFRK